ncbi:unnamed protein product [Ectocarpus sp. 8 AP-2014]
MAACRDGGGQAANTCGRRPSQIAAIAHGRHITADTVTKNAFYTTNEIVGSFPSSPAQNSEPNRMGLIGGCMGGGHSDATKQCQITDETTRKQPQKKQPCVCLCPYNNSRRGMAWCSRRPARNTSLHRTTNQLHIHTASSPRALRRHSLPLPRT